MSNRRQRRAAASQARANHAAPPPPANLSDEAADHLRRAVQSHQQGDVLAARHHYQQVLTHHPRNIDALNLLGVLLHQQGDLDTAADYLARAIKQHAATPELHYNLGNIRRDQQQHTQAAACFRKARALNPDYFEAIYNLGVVLHQLGQDNEAIEHLERALSLNDRFADGHGLLADIRLGRAEHALAIAGYEKALALDPNLYESHNNLAVVLSQTGEDDAALRHLEEALQINPTYADAHCNIALIWQGRGAPEQAEQHFRQAYDHAGDNIQPYLGLAAFLHAQGRLREALEVYRRALVCDPRSPAILNNLGSLFQDLRQPAEAIAHYEKALHTDPSFVDARANLAHALRAQGDLAEAIAHYHALLTNGGAQEGVIAGLAQALAPLAPAAFDATLYELIAVCFQGDGARHQDLAHVAAALIRHKYGSDWTSGDKTPDIAAFAEDPVLLALLERTVNIDPALERLLTQCRRHLLFAITGAAGATGATGAAEHRPAALRVMAALACQAHNNAYVWAVTEDEQTAVAELHKQLLQAPPPTDAPTPALLAFAMYRPLAKLPGLTTIDRAANPEPWWSWLLEVTVRQPAAEEILCHDIPALGKVADATSHAVQAQYESNPYPRWLSLRHQQAIPLTRRLALINPALDLNPPGDLREVLIAGCGTGQQPIQFALANRNVNILAVDLSRASLAYAKRMACHYHVENIRFMQADILGLGELGREFPVIECVGVLHHMADPAAGLAALTDRLVPGGFLRLGLYSQTARRHVRAIQDLAKQQDIDPTAGNIRHFRQKLLEQEAAPAATHPINIPDFYDLNGCRDLLFHVQEYCYSLPEIAELLAEAGLAFIGFDFDNPSILANFQSHHPAPEALGDLDVWADYETKNPDTFIGMYQFWSQKLR
ncbi:MAG: tetratricopeptide repeat protein [Alphaproteobacteria bacterium]